MTLRSMGKRLDRVEKKLAKAKAKKAAAPKRSAAQVQMERLEAAGRAAKRRVSSSSPSVEVEKPDTAAAEAAPQQGSFGFDTTHGFLGEEFLLWLWYRFETDGGDFRLGVRSFGISFDDLLVFAPLGDDDTQQTLRRGMPTKSAQALAALRLGHRLAKARLILGDNHGHQWSLTLDGTRMVFGAVSLPADDEGCESSEDRTEDRAGNWLGIFEAVAALFARFIDVRISDEWTHLEAPAITAWMRR